MLQVFQAESQGPCQALPINGKPIPFESDLFRGVIVVYIRHLATTPTQVFKGKKRLTWFALQVGVRCRQQAVQQTCLQAQMVGGVDAHTMLVWLLSLFVLLSTPLFCYLPRHIRLMLAQ